MKIKSLIDAKQKMNKEEQYRLASNLLDGNVYIQ